MNMELPSHPHVRLTRMGEVLQVTLDRVDQDNRISNSMLEALTDSVLLASQSSRLLVLRANGPDFCLGRDMLPPTVGSNTTVEQVLRDDAAPVLALIDAVLACPVPLLCAVQGRTWGMGLVLAAVADVSVAVENSRFRLRELERGIPPCLAMAPLLDRMPVQALSHLVLTAGELDVARALSWGLVGESCTASRLDIVVQDLVDKMLGFPDPAVRAVKRYLARAPRHDMGAAAREGAQLLAQVLAAR
ncbi:MAG: enoyl-CoA hydratase/isomerase family protein [Betaproteobacteria bacterium]|nr:enoyl-CoA hydratase/isomerase family protein [Betaproteobacteria bacterium]